MFKFSNKVCNVFYINKKEILEMGKELIKNSIKDNIKSYLIGLDAPKLVIDMIEKFSYPQKVICLGKRIHIFLNTREDLCVEDVIQVFCEKNSLYEFLIDEKKLNTYLESKNISEMIAILGINDIIEFDLDNNYLYNIQEGKYFLQWKVL